MAIDLLWIDGKPILHIVDTGKHYKNAIEIRSKRTEDIWTAFVEGWASTYIGYHDVLRIDQETTFTSSYLIDASTAHGIYLRFSGTEFHKSTGAVERYHDPL